MPLRSPSLSRLLAALPLIAIACSGAPPPEPPTPKAPAPIATPGGLRDPASFAGMADPAARSQAMFLEASRVMLHPRCVNCHPTDDSPRQREAHELHNPPVLRGDDDQGIPGLRCTSCHQDTNLELARVPGAPKWQLAPKSMPWLDQTPAAICAQVKDPKRNGGRSLAQIVDHSTHDKIVAWGWSPGWGREPAPGSQAQFGALMAAWVENGAACPQEEASR
ncbi:MAG: Isoquinoline 1-oxidoreductase subunit [Byssovorax sp.]